MTSDPHARNHPDEDPGTEKIPPSSDDAWKRPVEPYQPPPAFQPGYAPLPPPPEPEYPPTTQFPPVTPPGYGTPPPPPPRRSNLPLIGVITAVALLLCGGVVTATVLIVQNVAREAREAIDQHVPTKAPELPQIPTQLPTDLPGLPNLPGGKTVTVRYEVTGDGPAEIIYLDKIGEAPQQVHHVKLPWRFSTTMEGAAVVSVSAVRTSADQGTIRCRALVDGKEAAESSREGGFAAVSCNKFVFN